VIGKYQLEFNEKQFTAGISTNDTTSDGGLAPSSKGTNLVLSPGTVYATAAEVSLHPNDPTDNIIASSEDSEGVPVQRVFLGDTGNFYTLSSGVLAPLFTGSKTYIPGGTDFVAFNTDFSTFSGCYFATSATDIAKYKFLNGVSSSMDETWWSSTKSQGSFTNSGVSTAHPMVVFQSRLWVADVNTNHQATLHNITTGEVISLNVFTLGSANEFIYALAVDPSTGLMMISTSRGTNYGDTMQQENYVYLYDGFSSQYTRQIRVDDLVTAFHIVGGRVYCTYGNNLGVWNGNGVSFLRVLNNVNLVGAQLAYKHKMANYKNTLFVADGTQILAYGAINQAGGLQGTASPVFYYPYYAQTSTSFLSHIAHVGSGVIAAAYLDGTTKRLYLTDLTSTTAGSALVAPQTTYLPRPIFVRRMRVITTGITTTAGIGDTAIVDETGTSHQATVHKFVVATAQSPRYVFDFDFTNLKLQTLQVNINIDTQHFGIKRVIIYYDIAE
jgi:hypothetical protein